MSEIKHDPTPWKFRKDSEEDATIISDAAFYSVVTSDIDPANAEHIVKCVNAHDGLVEALREIAGSEDDDEAVVRNGGPTFALGLRGKARKALCAAGIEP